MSAGAWRVPGRIEVFGKHTDYAGGNVLIGASEQAVTAVARPGDQPGLVARSSAFPDPVSLGGGAEADLPAGHWGRYVATAWNRLTANFGPLPDAELSFSSDLPLASGMSSSSALVVASALALADLAGLRESELWAAELGTDRLRWASYLASVENGTTFGSLTGSAGVGTRGGSEDHTGMLCSRPGELGQFGFDPVARHRHVAVPADHVFAIAVSGVSAEKTGAAQAQYNHASDAIAESLRRWNEATGRGDRSLAAAVRSDDAALDRLGGLLDADLRTRVQHFVTESEELVPAAADALAAGDLDAFGAAADTSQHLAETLLGNQVPQTVALASSARELGAVAASAFGAGFGGSVWALVPRSGAEAFARTWLARHTSAFPDCAATASTLVTEASGPAVPLEG
ncbi:MAG: galactokinase family protein [Propionibacteriaceae bacterium]|nr:galactokinase family protein [Propionibacteriaceae bacterium]